MSDIAALLDEVASAGGEFALSGDRLSVRAPHPLPPELMERFRSNKPAVVQALKSRPRCSECGCPIVEDVRDWWNGEPVHHACGLQAWEREWQAHAPHRVAAVA